MQCNKQMGTFACMLLANTMAASLTATGAFEVQIASAMPKQEGGGRRTLMCQRELLGMN